MRAEVLGCGVLCRGQPLQVGHCLGGVRSDTAEEIQLGVVLADLCPTAGEAVEARSYEPVA